jgi:hypothetical protein
MKITTTMLLVWVLVVLAGFSYKTFGDEVEFRVTDLTYTWGPEYSFPVTLYQVGYTKHLSRGLGVRIMYGESDTASAGKFSAKIERMFVFNLHRNINIGRDWILQYGVNYTEYKEHGRPDTGKGYAVAIQYNINDSFAVKLSHDEYYEKQSEHFGLEETYGTGLSLVGRL